MLSFSKKRNSSSQSGSDSTTPNINNFSHSSSSYINNNSEIQKADNFLEALNILKNEIIFKKALLDKAQKIQVKFNTEKSLNKKEILIVLMKGIFFNEEDITNILKNNNEKKIIDSIISVLNQSTTDIQILYENIIVSLKTGHTLNTYFICKQLYECQKLSDLKVPSSIDNDLKTDRLKMLTIISELLEESLDDEEIDIAKQITTYYKIDFPIEFIYDSKLYIYFRNGNPLQFNTIVNKKQFRTISNTVENSVTNIQNLTASFFSQKTILLQQSNLLPNNIFEPVTLALADLMNRNRKKEAQFEALYTLLKLYEVEEELIELKNILDNAETYETGEGLSLIVDYDKLKSPIDLNLREELYKDCKIIDRKNYVKPNKKNNNTVTDNDKTIGKKPQEKALTITNKIPENVIIKQDDLSSSQNKTIYNASQEELIITNQTSQDIILEKEDLSSSSSSISEASIKNNDHSQISVEIHKKKDREQIKKEKEAQKRAIHREKMIAIANIGNVNYTISKDIISDITQITLENVKNHEKYYVDLFNINVKSFSRKDAEIILKKSGGEICSRSGSHVSLFLPNKSNTLRFIGATSFHGNDKSAQMESLKLLREAIYNHLSEESVEHLREILKNEFYIPSRKVEATSSSKSHASLKM